MSYLHKLTVQALEEHLQDLKSWQSFGRCLPGITQEDIDYILGEEHDDIANQKRALFEKWLQSHSSPTWKDVAIALELIEETEMASNFNKLFGGKSFTQPKKTDEVTMEMESSSELKELHSDFEVLFKKLQTSLTSLIKRKRVSLLQVMSVIKHEIVFKEDDLDNIESAPELFGIIDLSLNFLNFNKFQTVSERFLLPNDRTDMKSYTEKLKYLKMSAKIMDFKSLEFSFSNLSPAFLEVEIKLNSTLYDLSIESVETLLNRTYEKLSHHFQWHSVVINPLSVTFIVPQDLKLSLIDQSRRQLQFLRLTGMYSLKIGDTFVLNEEENPSYTINSALQEALKAQQYLNEIRKSEPQRLAEENNKSKTTQRPLLTYSWQKSKYFAQKMSSVKSCRGEYKTSHVHSKIQLFEHSSFATTLAEEHDGNNQETTVEEGKELSVAKLDEHLKNLVGWERFAIQLPSFKAVYNDIIKRDYPNDVQTQKYGVFKKWLSVHPGGTWNDVICALTKIDEYGIVSELVKKVEKHFLPAVETEPQVEPYDLKQSVVKCLKGLQSEFADLSVDIQKCMDSLVTEDPSILRTVVVYINQFEVVKMVHPNLIPSTYDLFHELRCHYSFLDFEVIEILFNYFVKLTKNRPALDSLEVRIEQYSDGLNLFKNTTEVKHLQDYLMAPLPGESESCDEIKIRLESVWGEQPIVLVERLVQTLFPFKLRLIKIMPGSVWAVFLIQRDCSQFVIDYSKQKLEFARSTGVINIEIGITPVVEEVEEENYTFEYGLLKTCENGNNEATQFLVDLGVDTSHTDSEGKTALMIACDSGHKEIVQTLLDTEVVDVDQQDNEGQTALMLSTANNHNDISKELLDAKANPNLKNHIGNTALHIACSNGNIDEANLLIASDANPLIRNSEKHTALDVSVRKNRVDIVKYLVSRVPSSEVTVPFIMACRQGKPILVTTLIKKLAESIPLEEEIILFYLGCTRGDSEYVRNSKLDPNTIALSGITPLMIASSCGHIKIVDYLIQVKADVNQCDPDGYSPLAYCIIGSQSIIVAQSLLEAGAIPCLAIEEVKIVFEEKGLNNIFNILLQYSALHLYTAQIQVVGKMKEIMESLVNTNRVSLYKLREHLSLEMHTTCLSESDDISTVFSKLALYHDFLNWNFLELLSENYHSFNDFKQYHLLLEELMKSVKLKDFRQVISLLPQETTPHNHNCLTIMLSKQWWEKPLKLVYKFCSIVFSSTYICHLSVSVDEKAYYLAYKLPNCFDIAQRFKKELCSSLGILKVTVNNIEFFSGDNNSYTFEKGLIEASFTGSKEAVEFLIDMNIDVNYFHHLQSVNDSEIMLNAICSTPLIVACKQGHYYVVEHLIENKADYTLCDDNGCTPFMLACGRGHADIAKLLVQNGVNIDEKNVKTGKTALIEASCKGYHKLVTVLLENGANPNITDINERTALHYSSINGHCEVIVFLIKYNVILDVPDDEGVTPLMLASQQGCYEVVKLLVQNQANVHVSNRNLQTALEFACVNGHKGVVELLLNNNAQPNLPNIDGWIPLILACQEGHLEVVNILLNFGLKPDVMNFKNRKTALIQASKKGHHSVVELLLAKGANPNRCDHSQHKQQCTTLVQKVIIVW